MDLCSLRANQVWRKAEVLLDIVPLYRLQNPLHTDCSGVDSDEKIAVVAIARLLGSEVSRHSHNRLLLGRPLPHWRFFLLHRHIDVSAVSIRILASMSSPSELWRVCRLHRQNGDSIASIALQNQSCTSHTIQSLFGVPLTIHFSVADSHPFAFQSQDSPGFLLTGLKEPAA